MRRPHPKLSLLLQKLPPGRHAGGLLMLTQPGRHHQEMRRWLMGRTEGRVALGRTAFGDILVFRDLRAKARARRLDGADEACDVALIDLNWKEMRVLAWSVESFLEQLEKRPFQQAYLRKRLYDRVRARLGEWADDEAYGFVPALALGGAEAVDSVQRVKWGPYQDLLFQL